MLLSKEDKVKFLKVITIELSHLLLFPSVKKWDKMKTLEMSLHYNCLTRNEVSWLDKKVFELGIDPLDRRSR